MVRTGICAGKTIYQCSDVELKKHYMKDSTYTTAVIKEFGYRARALAKKIGKPVKTRGYINSIKVR